MASRPPLIALSYFEVAARTKSFAKAAAELNVTPAAISHQIKALEDFLGAELFIRHHRRVSLTPAGRVALPELQDAFGLVNEAVEKIRRFAEKDNILTVCAEPLFATKWIVPRLQHFYALHPEAEVRLQASLHSVDKTPQPDFGTANLRRADIDVAIRLSYGSYAELQPIPLMPLDLVPMAKPGLITHDATENLSHFPLICDRTLSCYGQLSGWQEWFSERGITDLTGLRTMQFSNGLLALEAALAGQGVLLGSKQLLQQELALGKLEIVVNSPLQCPQSYVAVSATNSTERMLTTAFKQWLVEEFSV